MKKKIVVILLTTSMLWGHVWAGNWAEFYEINLSENLPSDVTQDEMSTDNQTYKVFGLYLDLYKILQRPDYKKNTHHTLIIVADTLEISNHLLFNLNNQRMFIFAREIVGKGAASINIDARQGNTSTLVVFLDQIDTRLSAITILPSGQAKRDNFKPSANALGQIVSVSAAGYTNTPITSRQASLILVDADAHISIFNKSFDMAASIYDQKPQTSLAMLKWTESVLRVVPQIRAKDAFTEDLYLQIANLKQFIQFASQSKDYVPGLSKILYESIYSAYLDTMKAYQERYDLFMQRGRTLTDREADARLMLNNMDTVNSAQNAIIARSEDQVSSITNSLEQQRNTFKAQGTNVELAKKAFQRGIDKYRTEQAVKISLQILGAIASAGSSLAAGDPSGLLDLVNSLPDTSEDIRKLTKQLRDLAETLKDVKEATAGVNQLSSQINENINQRAVASKFAKLNLTVPTLQKANLVWDTFLIEVKAKIKGAIDEDIGGADDYLVALEKLAAYGKSITATEINMLQELSRQIDLRITAEVSRKQSQRVKTLLTKITSDKTAIAKLERTFSRALINLKRPMFVALANYEAAYNYWALEDSKVTPSLNKSYEEYRREIAFLRSQEAATLDRFSPRPQDFTLPPVIIKHPEQLRDFANDGEISFILDMDHQTLLEYDRVRLKEVNIVLQGKNLPEKVNYSLDIRTTGKYKDRLKNKTFDFSAEPLFRRINYILLNNKTSEVDIITNGAIASDYAINYFKPTPFTTWSIKINNARNYDLSKVESIEVKFKGNAIPVPN